MHPEIDDFNVVSSIPRQRSARVVGEQAVILVDEAFLPSPTVVPLLVGEWPVDERVLLRNVSRSCRQGMSVASKVSPGAAAAVPVHFAVAPFTTPSSFSSKSSMPNTVAWPAVCRFVVTVAVKRSPTVS
ncbi:hypothetical protein [Bradyrhizobium sp. CCBAU 45394]|uniref:hypothetical protein n=1 Tax=Bradyrhizobium sp. CCBAU 45394 TaxID=1325087 RepID=UPI0023023BCC|nr:hypothetical protein [Bradyrhizobium sp. CCBAU 45394]